MKDFSGIRTIPRQSGSADESSKSFFMTGMENVPPHIRRHTSQLGGIAKDAEVSRF